MRDIVDILDKMDRWCSMSDFDIVNMEDVIFTVVLLDGEVCRDSKMLTVNRGVISDLVSPDKFLLKDLQDYYFKTLPSFTKKG
jgi:hypothetical protein